VPQSIFVHFVGMLGVMIFPQALFVGGSMLQGYKVVSSDDHVVEPADLWISRLDRQYRNRAPVIMREDRGDRWYTDGIRGTDLGLVTQVGMRFDNPEAISFSGFVEDVRPGGYDPAERLKDMDVDGVDISIVYPTVGLRLYAVQDSNLLTVLFRVYNDWVGEFCTAYPDRLKAIAMLNVDDVPQAVRELECCAKNGFVGAMIPVYPAEDKRYFLPQYDLLWSVAEDLRMPLGLHIVTNRAGSGQESTYRANTTMSFFVNADHWVRMSIADMIFAGVFERHPNLKVGAVEHELLWVPHFMERMDYYYTQMPKSNSCRLRNGVLPSDYFRQNVFLGFQEDALGVCLREHIGAENLLWGSDYPHQESTWPNSQKILTRILVCCGEEDVRNIVGGNASRIYNL
jgi:predicted TIM-barrel fold metal-dependent hydrolase